MSVYDRIQRGGSLLEECRIDIPGGAETEACDWYPLVMAFSDDAGFSGYIGEPARLTILYDFPSFSMSTGCSRLYDPESELYSSFYGAYMVRLESGEPFGFDESGHADADEVIMVPAFDYQYLVLDDFGLSREDMVFDCSVTDVREDVRFADEEGWTLVRADLTVNGAAHQSDGFRRSYLQYGSPGYDPGPEGPFAPVRMYGIIAGKYFPDKNMSIFFYVLAADEQAALDTWEDIVSKSSLDWPRQTSGAAPETERGYQPSSSRITKPAFA